MCDGRFQGKVVVVTGGGSGIGAAASYRFGAEGATVVLAGRTQAKLDAVLAEAPRGAKLIGRLVDVSDEWGITKLIEEVAHEHGRLDTLVNNAAVLCPGTVEQVGTDAWRHTMSTNVDGVFFASRAALPHLRAVGGSIVNVGSTSGLGADWGIAAYDTSKAAVVNLTNAMALDHGGEGVRVNAVHPGFTATAMTAPVLEHEVALAAFRNRMPLARPGEPAEIAAVIAFLASDDARFVNGAHLRVDGGIGSANGNPHVV
ncbi:SDR family NAD(P)-dependent oxidoreductase [Streptomyces sp. WMMC500]|uniref:SDR family NAD(P)-dependent oxidoreductase n=1 Tax=Streptomyces sp. WMMC500 TaxID=3015154 RepID=UPI00248BFCE6|nr:SDR family oxidoreductase [Streptomyces sp. WMMC500]WBB62034.1 SDR family NAD(P)-dependent oxidoreductase [Streptomyces sp. WMMC500]